MQPQTAIVEQHRSVDTVKHELLEQARACMETCNWRLGELAFRWVEETGGTDAEFGERIGLTKKQIQQRRAVWVKFGNPGSRFNQLRAILNWSHFRAAVSWEDSEALECLQWAADADATKAEMCAWRAAQRGEPLLRQSSDELDDISDCETVLAVVSPERATVKAGSANSGEGPAPEQPSAAKDKPARKERPSKGSGGPPREKARQPASIDPASFNVDDACDHLRTELLDLAAPFVAARKHDAFIQVIRAVMNDIAAVKPKGN